MAMHAACEVANKGGCIEADDAEDRYWRWLEAQIPAIAAASQSNKRSYRLVGEKSGGVVRVKSQKRSDGGYFTLQWTMDNIPLIHDGLWCVGAVPPSGRARVGANGSPPPSLTVVDFPSANHHYTGRRALPSLRFLRLTSLLSPSPSTAPQARVRRLQRGKHLAHGDASQGAERRPRL